MQDNFKNIFYVTRLENTFKQAQREKFLPQDPSPFEEEYNRYIHPQNAYKKLDEAPKQPWFFQTMLKQFNTNQEQFIDEETKPSASQILTITNAEVQAFGSKEKAINIRNELIKLNKNDTKEDFEKRKKTVRDKRAREYHPDRQGGNNDAQAFINKIHRYVDFDLAQKFWDLPARDRKA